MNQPREFLKGGFYHVFNRGINKEVVFREKGDFVFYLYKMKELLKKFPIVIHCYNLIPNHYHQLPQQTSDKPISSFYQSLHTSLGNFLNRKYGRRGPVFQGRPQVKTIQNDDYLLDLSFYIHLNTILEKLQHQTLAHISSHQLDKLLTEAENDPWNSYGVYLGLREDGIAHDKFILSLLSDDLKKARKEYRRLAKEMLVSKKFLKIRDLTFDNDGDSGNEVSQP